MQTIAILIDNRIMIKILIIDWLVETHLLFY